MMATVKPGKQECLNPHSKRRMFIDAELYQVIFKAIKHSLKGGKQLPYAVIEQDVKDYIREHQVAFDGTIGWYTVAVKNDLEARGIIKTKMVKGKKINALT